MSLPKLLKKPMTVGTQKLVDTIDSQKFFVRESEYKTEICRQNPDGSAPQVIAVMKETGDLDFDTALARMLAMGPRLFSDLRSILNDHPAHTQMGKKLRNDLMVTLGTAAETATGGCRVLGSR